MSTRRQRLRRRRKHHAASVLMRVAVAALVALLALGTFGVATGFALAQSWLQDLPDPDAPGAFDVARATEIYSADGKLLARLYLENRRIVPISKMSTDLIDAVVAVEDQRFYEHNGVDSIGLMRAVVVNFTEGFGEEGASTITQQYIRNTILLNERTEISLARKVREAYLAMELEKRYSKREILEMYLNAVYFGDGAYGAQAASRTYFATDADDLTLAQAALLAGLPQQPSRLDPYDNPDGAIARRNEVLLDMYKNGYITRDEMLDAQNVTLELKRAKDPEDGIYSAPYFVAHVKKELQAKFSPAVVFKGGLKVTTTLDSKMQKYAEDAVYDRLGNRGPEGALVSIDPRNGYVKALVGGRDFHKNRFNLATQAHRQPGSAFKTFVLVTAIEEGMPPSFIVDSSSPAAIPTKPRPWIVSNSEGRGRGVISLSSATRASVNTVFARVIWELGAKKVAKVAKRMGIVTELPAYPSIALGSKNVTPLEMASAYGTLAAGGIHHEPVVIKEVVDPNGTVLFKAKKKGKRALDKEVAGAATEVLRGVISGGTATRARIGRPAAGKTGTSQNYRDVWFVGYTPQLVTSVWVGHRTEKPIYVNGSRAFGGTVCAPIWGAYMKKALKGKKVLDFPKVGRPKYTPSKFHIPVSRPPKVTGMSLDEAESKLEGRKFSVEYVYSDKKKGTVIKQKSKDGKITLVVSKGPKPEEEPVEEPEEQEPPTEEPPGSGETSPTP